MKKLWFFIPLLYLIYACPIEFFNEDQVTGDELFITQVDTIISKQEDIADAIQSALLQMDTLSALAKVAQDFQSDPSLKSIMATREGLSMEYKNGMIGVVTLFFGMAEDPFLDEPLTETRNTFSVPAAKKTLYLITEYEKIKWPGEHLAVAAKAQLTKPGFSFEIARGPQFNLDRLKNLEGNGIIHFYSHGGLFNDDPNYAYLCTGEKFDKSNYLTVLANQAAFQKAEIGFNTTIEQDQKIHRFLVLPAFILNNNDFSNDSTMIYGSFCYSGLGDWSTLYSVSHAISYLGYDWKIGANTNKSWMTNMYVEMCDTSKNLPVKLKEWLLATPRSYKSSKSPKPTDNGKTYILLWADPDACFWKPEVKNEILRIDVDLYIEDAQFKFVVDANESFGGGAHRAFVSTREGTSTHVGKTVHTTFNKSWFGTDYTGNMTIYLNSGSVDVDLTQVRKTGSCTSTYTISKSNVPFNTTEGAYYQTGSSVHSGLSTSFYKQCTASTEQLVSYNQHSNDYFKVDVVYR